MTEEIEILKYIISKNGSCIGIHCNRCPLMKFNGCEIKTDKIAKDLAERRLLENKFRLFV